MKIKNILKPKYYNILFIIILFLFILNPLKGQVTIGSGIEPIKGSVLDLKEFTAKADNSTSEKGIIIPRVALVTQNSLSPLLSGADLSDSDLAKKLTGILVYNVSEVSGLKEGLCYWDGTQWVATGQFWSLTGNTGTDPATNFLGTTDDKPLVFKVNSQLAGYIGNTSLGNLSYGLNANPLNNGSLNVAIGRNSLNGLTSGNINIGIGEQTLEKNTTGSSNIAIGYSNLGQNTTGSDNIAVGSNVLNKNITATGNIGIGRSTLQNTVGANNTAIGRSALINNDTGSNNIAIGWEAGSGISTGNNNIFIGVRTSLPESSENKMNIGNLVFGNNMTGTILAPSGNVGIGTASVDPSAILELNSTNKGFLGPRIALQNTTDIITIPNPAAGLLVYNLGTAGLTYAGYIYWNGNEWRNLSNSLLSPGSIGNITCNGITATPSTYSAGTSYSGTMVVPYTGGDGGIYPAQTIGPINGLTATLASGNFNVGAGTLAYTVSGTPTISSPLTTIFPINIGGVACNAVIGAGDGISPGDLVFYRTTLDAGLANVWLSAYANDLPVLGGKLRLDAYFNASSNGTAGSVTMYPRLVNISSEPVKLWFSAMTTVDHFNAGNYLMAVGGYVELDNGIYYNVGYNDILGATTPKPSGSGAANHQEVVTVDLSLDNKWYRIYYFPIVDNMNTTTTADNQRIIYLSIQRLY